MGRDVSRADDHQSMGPVTSTVVMAPASHLLDHAAVPNIGASLKARVFNGPGLCSTLASAWDALFSRVPGASYNLSRLWQESFITAGRCGDQVVAVSAWYGERLATLLVLAIRRRVGLHFAEPVGTGYPGYLGLLAEPNSDAAISLIAATCVRQRLFDVLCLHDVASDDAATRRFVADFNRFGFGVWRVHRTVCWRAQLGCTFEEFLAANKSAKSRQTLRRKERQVHKAGKVVIERIRSTEITPDVITRLARLRSASWMKRRGALLLNESFERAWLQHLAEADMIRIWFLSIDGDDAACIVAIVANGRLHYRYPAFKLTYEHLSVGQVLLQYSIADACREGLQAYDFGHSDADYKRFWATERHDVERVFVGRGAIGSLAAVGLAQAWRMTRNHIMRRWAQCVRTLININIIEKRIL